MISFIKQNPYFIIITITAIFLLVILYLTLSLTDYKSKIKNLTEDNNKLRRILNKTCDVSVVEYNICKLDKIIISTYGTVRLVPPHPSTKLSLEQRIEFVKRFPEYEHLLRPYKKVAQ
jgi:hypothetical protein